MRKQMDKLIVVCGTNASGKSGLGVALAQRFGVMSIPTLVAMKDGKVLATRVGVQSADALKAMLA